MDRLPIDNHHLNNRTKNIIDNETKSVHANEFEQTKKAMVI